MRPQVKPMMSNSRHFRLVVDALYIRTLGSAVRRRTLANARRFDVNVSAHRPTVPGEAEARAAS
jgi:hypothetical protein